MGRGSGEKRAARNTHEDPDEVAALAAATACLTGLVKGVADPQAVTIAVISRWIIERAKAVSGRRLGEVAFDLGDAKLRGVVEACLPAIAEKMGHIPPDKPLFELSKVEVVDVFVAAAQAISAAKLGYLEQPDDQIPF